MSQPTTRTITTRSWSAMTTLLSVGLSCAVSGCGSDPGARAPIVLDDGAPPRTDAFFSPKLTINATEAVPAGTNLNGTVAVLDRTALSARLEGKLYVLGFDRGAGAVLSVSPAAGSEVIVYSRRVGENPWHPFTLYRYPNASAQAEPSVVAINHFASLDVDGTTMTVGTAQLGLQQVELDLNRELAIFPLPSLDRELTQGLHPYQLDAVCDLHACQ